MVEHVDFWEILDVEGIQFEINDQPTEIRPENAMEESRIQNEGRKIDIIRYKRRVELENRKKALYEHEIREKAKNYRKLIDAVVSRFGKDNEVLLEALYWKEKLRSLNQPIGVLEDFVNWIEPLLWTQNENDGQNEPQPKNKAELFRKLISEATVKHKSPKKAKKKAENDDKAKDDLETGIKARFRLYLIRGGRVWLIYVNNLRLECLKAFYDKRLTKYTRTAIKSLYIADEGIIAVPIKKDELSVLKDMKKVISLAETMRAIETIRQERAKRRQLSPESVKNAIIGFYRLFSRL